MVRTWGLVCCGWPEAEERGPGQARTRCTGPGRSAQYVGRLGCEPCSGCWAKSGPMTERVVGGTLMDTPLEQRAASPLPRLQRPQVAAFNTRKGDGFAPGATPGAVTQLVSENSNRVPALQSKEHTLVPHGTLNPWEVSLSIQRIGRGAKWLDTFFPRTGGCRCPDGRGVGTNPNACNT